MNIYDFILVIIILLIFAGLYFVNIFGIGINNIKKNWPLYRCNPVIMPFANIFGHNVEQNFAECIENIQKVKMGNLMGPLHYTQSIINTTTNDLSQSVNYIRAFFNKIRDFIEDIIHSVMSVFINIIIAIQKLLFNIIDLFGKLTGASSIVGGTIMGGNDTAMSIWNGPPGQTLRAVSSFCFAPETLVKTHDKEYIEMKNLELGSILNNGERVESILKLINVDKYNNYKDSLYKFKNNDNNKDIIVSGHHLIFDELKKRFIFVKNHKDAVKLNYNLKELCCLITSKHTIKLGDYIFHDWEDNIGSISKNI